MSVVGLGVAEGYLTHEALTAVARDGLARLPVDGRKVLVVISDGTRTMPMPLMFETLQRELGPRVAALDYLVALGTHSPMSDVQLSALIGRPVENGVAGPSRIFNHRWDDPATFAALGSIPARDVADLTQGRLREDVPVALNRLATEYGHVLICGPVFPHEVAGFSGGTKYLFPGIAAPGIAGFFCGDVRKAWRQAAILSSRRHIVWVEKPYDRVLAVMPRMYDDLWTAAKGAYKSETAERVDW